LKRALLRADNRNSLSTAKKYVDKVEKVIQMQILGKPHRPHSYSIPFDQKKKIILDFNLNNGPCRKIMQKFDLLVVTCLVDDDDNNNIDDGDNDNGLSMEEERQLWNTAIFHYKEGQELMLSKSNLSDDDILLMQSHFDMFSQIMIYQPNFELDFVTNYTHMISSSHVSEYAMRVRCLYRHSQQGFEGVVGQLKKFVFRRTNRGGRGTGNRLVALTHHRSRLFAYMLNESLLEMKIKLKEQSVEVRERNMDETVPRDQEILSVQRIMSV
jgi:hypothetical protein